MSIKYLPDEMLKKIAPQKKIKRLVSRKLTLKKAALAFVDDIDFLNKKRVTEVALKTIRAYQSRVDADPDLKMSDLTRDPAQLIQRVQNEIVMQVADGIREKYRGEQYKWLPSDAEEPDPEHQLNYGMVFAVGEGEMPGDRFGCRCGMEILVPDSRLEL